MVAKDITSCRGVLEFLAAENELVVIDRPVDPLLEVSGIAKALDNGPALLFTNVKGYPGQRVLNGLFSRGDRVAKLFSAPDSRSLKLKAALAIKNPIRPRLVSTALCQEQVITRDLDVLKTMPILKYTATDPGRILAGGNVLVSDPDGGHCISYKRIHFRGPDWSTMAFNPGSHFEYWVLKARKDRRNLPLTINISPSPAVQAVASSGGMLAVVPVGSDELAFAGAIQGAPVDICKATSVEAYSIANAEWVIEGYINTSEVMWESEEAEQKKDFARPFFPEGYGYLGRAHATYKFQATAITRRRESPILYAPIAHSLEYSYETFVNDAFLYEMLNRQAPGVVADVNALAGMMGQLGVVIQVRKERRRDETYIKNLIPLALGVCPALRWVILVDDDVDIYNADEVIWALMTRMDPKEDITLVPPGQTWAGTQGAGIGPSAPAHRVGFDATVPFERRGEYSRGEFPAVDLEKWLSKDQISAICARQSEYAKLFARQRV